MTNKSVWATLSAIDCSAHIEKKGQLSYLSWAWAWQTLNEHYPESTFEYFDPTILANDTVEVSVAVIVESKRHVMWLPVMDNRNKSIVNPTSRDISDSRIRCLVKCIAMHGLGLYIYAGEAMPEASKTEVLTPAQAEDIKDLLEQANGDVVKFLGFFKADSVDEMLAIHYPKAVAALKAKIK
jgi:hypothetical protein